MTVLDIGHWTLDIGHWTLDIEHWILDICSAQMLGTYGSSSLARVFGVGAFEKHFIHLLNWLSSRQLFVVLLEP